MGSKRLLGSTDYSNFEGKCTLFKAHPHPFLFSVLLSSWVCAVVIYGGGGRCQLLVGLVIFWSLAGGENIIM